MINKLSLFLKRIENWVIWSLSVYSQESNMLYISINLKEKKQKEKTFMSHAKTKRKQ